MNINDLRNKINKNCRVLILQHTFGLTPKYRKEILQFAKINKLTVIEDLAHGFDPSIFGSLNYQLLATSYYLLSFGRSKPFSSVFGAAFISPKKINFAQLKNPSNNFILHCLVYKPITFLIKKTYDIYLGRIIHQVANILSLLIPEISEKEKSGQFDEALNKTYLNALAILLLQQLKKYDQMQKQRLTIAKYYEKRVDQSLLRYPMLIENRDKIIEKARRNNIFLGQWYDQVVVPKSLDLNKVFYHKGSCPVAEKVCQQIINLPTLIDINQANTVIKLLKSCKRLS